MVPPFLFGGTLKLSEYVKMGQLKNERRIENKRPTYLKKFLRIHNLQQEYPV